MSLISWKIELKLEWTKYSIFSENGNDNANHNDNDSNIAFAIKDTNYMFLQ